MVMVNGSGNGNVDGNGNGNGWSVQFFSGVLALSLYL